MAPIFTRKSHIKLFLLCHELFNGRHILIAGIHALLHDSGLLRVGHFSIGSTLRQSF